jgi:TatD DNase family protein
MLIDTHCHLNFDAFDSDREDALTRARFAGVQRIIIPAVDFETSLQAITLATAHSVIYAAVGIHPNSASEHMGAVHIVAAWADAPKVVAIGEIGLDYHWETSSKADQRTVFEQQLTIAAELELPVIIHNREASDDIITILEAWSATLPQSLVGRAGVLHSFSAPQAIAERAIAAGFYLGFTGPITFRNAESLRHIAALIPEDRMLIETDSPFLAPTPHRGKRNEPAYVALVAERLASLRQRSLEEIATITSQNAERLFRFDT